MFNDFFFCTVGQKLHDNVQNSKSKSFKSFFTWKCLWLFIFSPITKSEITDVVLKLDVNKSAGYDGFNARIVKCSIHAIFSPLCNIFNSSIENGIFPSALKIAKVIPVFKSGNRNLLNNYRPVSVLSIFSKVLEKIVYKLISFIQKNNILYRKQFGFRKGHSTSHALIDFINKLTTAFEDKLTVVGIIWDLSKRLIVYRSFHFTSKASFLWYNG